LLSGGDACPRVGDADGVPVPGQDAAERVPVGGKRAQPRGKSAIESPAGAQIKGKSGGGDGRTRRKALGKRRRSPSRKEGEDDLTGANAATGEGEDEERRASYERGMEEKNEADRVSSATATASQSATEAVPVSR
jgi:hypothetical protein